MHLLLARGSTCPRCGQRTERVRTPVHLKPVRWLFPSIRRRACSNPHCHWRGFATSGAGAHAPPVPEGRQAAGTR